MEREADDDIAAGRVKRFDDVEALFADLEGAIRSSGHESFADPYRRLACARSGGQSRVGGRRALDQGAPYDDPFITFRVTV
jgi:hypothetical protein